MGKELAARIVHERSPWRKGPFVAVNCGVLSGEMVAAELFGAQKGAYTGATENRKGAFERAEGGTLFLDEIGELPPEAQAMLLRVLEVGEIQVLGGPARQVHVRVVCATHRDLPQRVTEGRFRLDLLHRLDSACIALPRLRDRPEDHLPLLREFLGDQLLPPGAQTLLNAHPWPGNVRQLRNVARRLHLRQPFGRLHLEDLREVLEETRPPELRVIQGGRDDRKLQRRQLVAGLLAQGEPVATAQRKSGLPKGTFFRYLREVRMLAMAPALAQATG